MAGSVAFAIEAFKRIHPVEFERRFLSQGTRHDGRAPGQFRALSVAKGTISTAHGSSTVRLGNTTVVCGIKAEVCEPDVKTPDEGYLVTNVDLSPMCSARFRAGPPGESAQVASEHLARLFAGGVVDLRELCIESGQAAWVLSADIVCLRHDGNIIDAAVVALMAALENLAVPAAAVESGVVSADRTKGRRLTLRRRLFPATFTLVDDTCVVADADDAEEQLATAAVLVVVDARGRLANVWKRGAGAVGRQAIAQCL
ncbi:Exosome complex component RRP43, partial [Coemansia nantahalensis]